MKNLYQERLVNIPEGCTVQLKDKIMTFEGPLGKQEYDLSRDRFSYEILEDKIRVVCWYGDRKKNARLGTVASHIRNNAEGVVHGFKFVLRAAYRHFSINISVADAGKSVAIKNFLGAKNTETFPVRGQSKAMIGDHKDVLIIQGINLEDVSQTAAHIHNTCAKKKQHDVRIFLDGIFVENRTKIVE